MTLRVSGWILPDGAWVECKPWEHIKAAKELQWLQAQKMAHTELHTLWHDPDEEKLRVCLARHGLIKVCYHLVDADEFNNRQLRCLQSLYSLMPLDEDIEFIGRIRLKMQVRLFLKLKDADRLNTLGSFG